MSCFEVGVVGVDAITSGEKAQGGSDRVEALCVQATCSLDLPDHRIHGRLAYLGAGIGTDQVGDDRDDGENRGGDGESGGLTHRPDLLNAQEPRARRLAD